MIQLNVTVLDVTVLTIDLNEWHFNAIYADYAKALYAGVFEITKADYIKATQEGI